MDKDKIIDISVVICQELIKNCEGTLDSSAREFLADASVDIAKHIIARAYEED